MKSYNSVVSSGATLGDARRGGRSFVVSEGKSRRFVREMGWEEEGIERACVGGR